MQIPVFPGPREYEHTHLPKAIHWRSTAGGVDASHRPLQKVPCKYLGPVITLPGHAVCCTCLIPSQGHARPRPSPKILDASGETGNLPDSEVNMVIHGIIVAPASSDHLW